MEDCDQHSSKTQIVGLSTRKLSAGGLEGRRSTQLAYPPGKHEFYTSQMQENVPVALIESESHSTLQNPPSSGPVSKLKPRLTGPSYHSRQPFQDILHSKSLNSGTSKEERHNSRSGSRNTADDRREELKKQMMEFNKKLKEMSSHS